MRAMLLACGLLLSASPALAQRTDLPPADKVNEALDNHPSVAAAAARVEAARARGDMLRRGSHEVTVSGSYVRRTVDREGGFNEFDTTISRPFRLPGKAALDRQVGAVVSDALRDLARGRLPAEHEVDRLDEIGLPGAVSLMRTALPTVQFDLRAVASGSQRLPLGQGS